MRNALNATGRPIVYSICQWGTESSWQWAPTFGNSWRTTGDIQANWNSIVGCFWQSQQHFERSTTSAGTATSSGGAWLDPDMLEVGNGELTYEENKSHFSLWILAKAPLLLGNDLRNMTTQVLNVITKVALIEIHQDPSTPQATCFEGCDKTQWCAPTIDGEHVVRESDIFDCHNQTTITTSSEEDSNKHWTSSSWIKQHVTGLEEDEDHHEVRGRRQDALVMQNGVVDYSMFATTRHTTGVVVMLIVNWHDDLVLTLDTINVVQSLGVAPFPYQRVTIQDLWTHQSVTRITTTTTPSNNNNNSQKGGDNVEDDNNNNINNIQKEEDTASMFMFTFEDLKQVPIPPIPPHGCLVYSFTTTNVVSHSFTTTNVVSHFDESEEL